MEGEGVWRANLGTIDELMLILICSQLAYSVFIVESVCRGVFAEMTTKEGCALLPEYASHGPK